MAVTYALRFDDNYGVESLKKHRALTKSRWVRWTLKTVCALGMAALGALGIAIKSDVVVTVAAVTLLLLALGPYIDFLVIRRRYRKHAQYGSDISAELSHDGLKLASRDSNSDLRWSSFVSAAELPDGLILHLAPWHYVWLPDSGIRSGDPDEARAIAKGKITNYRGV